jgi:hypothetical protein
MRGFGVLVLIVGALIAGYALLIFDPTVAGYGGGRINNIGKLSDRQNLLIAGCVAAVIGALMAIFGGTAAAPEDTSPEEKFKEAIASGKVEVMKQMLKTGQITATSGLPSGCGWLQYAALRGAVPQSLLLLKFGADPTAKDGMGRTAIEVAGKAHCRELVREFNAWTPRDAAELAALITPRTSATSPTSSEQDQKSSFVTELQQLVSLRDAGALTPSEFDAAKARLLGLTSSSV